MSKQTRRRLLELAGAAAVTALAGCTSTGSQPGGEASGEDQPDTESEQHDDVHTEEGSGHHEEEDGHHEEGTDEHTERSTDHHGGEDEHHQVETDEHGHNHDEGTPDGPSQTAEVGLSTEGQQHHFKPHVAWVEPGGTVTWQLESGSHDVVAYHPDNDRPLRIPKATDPWSTELLSEEGATVERTFETEGVYDYFCTPHESLGMVGTVIVGNPDAHEQPALEEPQSSLPKGARNELTDLADKVNEALGHTH